MVTVTNGVSEREIKEQRLPLFLRLGYWTVPQPEPEAEQADAPEDDKKTKE